MPLFAGLALISCAKSPDGGITTSPVVATPIETSETPQVVTADIAAGIEKYIEEETRQGEGYFRLAAEGRQYALKLVRIHMEYLSNLGPRRHFACVDLVDTKGDVYDVDFFLSGDPGVMTVTETTIHKKNGVPYYAWKRMEDKTWKRVEVDTASQALLDVVPGSDSFEFRYTVTLPRITAPARIWIPYPQSDRFQRVELASLQAPAAHRVLAERGYENRVFFLELGAEATGQTIDIRYKVERKEKAAYSSDGDVARYLTPERLVPLNESFKKIAADIVRGKKGDLVRARAIYDHVIESFRYQKYGDGHGKGDAVYACDARTGNCTDFHAYFMALARSAGIPARFAIGAAIPAARNEGGVDGYHCWVEFHAEGKWWPVDISEANKYSSLATYYFGHNPANRIELSRGRDLVLEPGPASGPINFLAYPVLEVAGEPVRVVPEFSFTRF